MCKAGNELNCQGLEHVGMAKEQARQGLLTSLLIHFGCKYLIFLYMLFLLVACVLINISWSIHFDLCENVNIFCVQVNSSYPCSNCNYTTIQEVLENQDLGSGGFTIYLVGNESITSSFRECVELKNETTEDFQLANTIKPYPTHSILWLPDGDCSNVKIEAYWWKITGDGGSLTMENLESVSASTYILTTDAKGILLSNLTIKNSRYDLQDFMSSDLSSIDLVKGVFYEDITFKGLRAGSVIKNKHYCSSQACTSSSFVDEYGEDKRLWIRNNRFEVDEVSIHIKGYPLGYTLEGNYFSGEVTISSILLGWSRQEGVSIFNNVFEIKSTWQTVIYLLYRKEGYWTSYGKNRIFNNLIILDEGELTAIFKSRKWDLLDGGGYPDPVFFYNNLIQSNHSCVPIVLCYDLSSVANIRFQNNKMSNPSCTTSDWSTLVSSTCNTSAISIISDDGNNKFGEIPFYRKGEIPFPYYDLYKEVSGMLFQNPRNTSWSKNPYILPIHDFQGRPRPGLSKTWINRTSIGPFEFQGLYTYYPLCDNLKVFCVEVSSDYPCLNCDSKSVQEIHDDFIDTAGGNIIYLVGNDTTTLNYTESIVISKGSGIEDFTNANIIQPYPGHSIHWYPEIEKNNAIVIQVKSYWWKITGPNLVFFNPQSNSTNFDFLLFETNVIVSNFSVVSLKTPQQLYLLRFRLSYSGDDLLGILVENISISGEYLYYPIMLFGCYCEFCNKSSFTDAFGEDKRIWIRNNHIEVDYSYRFIYGYPLSYTIEGNYFSGSVARIFSIIWGLQQGVSVYNNIFHIKQSQSLETIFFCYYRKRGFCTSLGKIRFFNNLIVVDDGGSLESLFHFYRWDSSDLYLTSDTVYFYNNLIKSSSCVPIVKCESGAVSNLQFQYNQLSNPDCKKGWGDIYSTACIIPESILDDLGNNDFYSILFKNGSYDLASDSPGMPFDISRNQSSQFAYVLPDHDIVDRPRPGLSGSMNRTSKGPYEYQGVYTYYSLCDAPKVFCVEVNSEFPCWNCHSTSLQTVHDELIDSSGSFTIYLVGNESLIVNYTESVVITKYTPEDIINGVNTIQPYPGHIIHWYPLITNDTEGVSILMNLDIRSYWWKITGGDDNKNLVFTNFKENDKYFKILRSINNIMFSNFTVLNNKYKLYFMLTVYSDTFDPFFGVLVEGILFTGTYSYYPLYMGKFMCEGNCSSGSFTDEFGENKRIWIKNNRFEIDTYRFIYGNPLSFTVERNYFIGSCSKGIYYYMLNPDGLIFYNNIFHLNSSLHQWDSALFIAYRKGGFYKSYGKNRFFNNLFIAENGGILESMFWFYRWDIGDGNEKSDPIYFYNNLIQSDKCVPIVRCTDTDTVTNVVYKYNQWNSSSCSSNKILTLLSTCDTGFSSIIDEGNNIFEEISFQQQSNSFSNLPKFDLFKDSPGMMVSLNTSWDYPYLLPDNDFLERQRGVRTSKGVAEYQCPSECINGTRTDCQNNQCGCLENYFGDISCEYEYIQCPNCTHGNCSAKTISSSSFYYCDCEDNFWGEICNITSCFGIDNNDTKRACSGKGLCKSIDNCICDKGYFGSNCNVTGCGGVFSNDTEKVCGKKNVQFCWPENTCVCDPGYFTSQNNYNCNVTSCNDIFSNISSEVCSGHGDCISLQNCSCYSFPNISSTYKYFGEDCEFHYCFGVSSNDSLSCSGHGSCIDYNNCTCLNNYTNSPISTDFKNCSTWKCFGVYHDDIVGGIQSVCHGFGNCTKPDTCDCFDDYNITNDCSSWECFGFERKDTEEVCSNHGNCVAIDNCDCITSSYTGQKCNTYTCYNISRELENSCGIHGACVGVDDCDCNLGYFSSNEPIGDTCDLWRCEGINKDLDQYVCSNRGTCISPDNCVCRDDYEGNECETFSCGFDWKQPTTCSGHGTCNAPADCTCSRGYSGVLCQTNDMYLTIMTPILSTVGLGIFLLMLILFGCLFCALCLCICVMVVGIIIIFGFIIVVSIQKLRMRKFEQLQDIDLILEEQKAENDTSVAHIKMNKKLFEIPYDEIKILSIVGEGGSSSIVYKAKWKMQIVAFKCFKTRLICSSQNNFDEFESEVQVFGSISHPNIVSFYGCTLNPPRVGILMEFCEKGESLMYIKKYERKKNNRYPNEERIRMLGEIASAMDYLHSRNIVHRDLKCENVLVDKSESCKLMDFGLSKISERMSQQKTKRVGTSLYMAPEVVLGEGNYSEKCDIFSYAIMIWVMITGNPHPYGADNFNIEMRVANDPSFRPDTNELRKVLDPKNFWMIRIAENCWNFDPKNRFSFSKIGKIIGQEENIFRKEQQQHYINIINNNNTIKEQEEQEDGDDDDEKNKMRFKILEMEKKMKEMKQTIEILEKKNKELEMNKEEEEEDSDDDDDDEKNDDTSTSSDSSD